MEKRICGVGVQSCTARAPRCLLREAAVPDFAWRGAVTPDCPAPRGEGAGRGPRRPLGGTHKTAASVHGVKAFRRDHRVPVPTVRNSCGEPNLRVGPGCGTARRRRGLRLSFFVQPTLIFRRDPLTSPRSPSASSRRKTGSLLELPPCLSPPTRSIASTLGNDF